MDPSQKKSNRLIVTKSRDMSADAQHTTLRWILRCCLAFLLSTPIASAISPVRWDYPSTLGLARFHGLSILKHSSHTTSSVRSSDTSAAPITASDDRTSVVTAFLHLGFARFNLLNGGTTESVVGSPSTSSRLAFSEISGSIIRSARSSFNCSTLTKRRSPYPRTP